MKASSACHFRGESDMSSMICSSPRSRASNVEMSARNPQAGGAAICVHGQDVGQRHRAAAGRSRRWRPRRSDDAALAEFRQVRQLQPAGYPERAAVLAGLDELDVRTPNVHPSRTLRSAPPPRLSTVRKWNRPRPRAGTAPCGALARGCAETGRCQRVLSSPKTSRHHTFHIPKFARISGRVPLEAVLAAPELATFVLESAMPRCRHTVGPDHERLPGHSKC